MGHPVNRDNSLENWGLPDDRAFRPNSSFKFIAVNSKGEISRGQLEAFDRRDLVVQLESQGLHLTNCQELPASLPARPSVAGAGWRAVEGSLSDFLSSRWPATLIILASTVLMFWMSFNASTRRGAGPAWPPKKTLEKIHQVKMGMTRPEIQLLFPARAGVLAKGRVTQYFEPPDATIEIGYKLSAVSPDGDTVTGVVSVYRARQ